MLLLPLSADLVRRKASGTTRAYVAGWEGTDRQVNYLPFAKGPRTTSPYFIEPTGELCMFPLPLHVDEFGRRMTVFARGAREVSAP